MYKDLTGRYFLGKNTFKVGSFKCTLQKNCSQTQYECGFDLWSGQAKDYWISISCFFAISAAALKSKIRERE